MISRGGFRLAFMLFQSPSRMGRPTLTYLINCIDYGGAEVGMIRLLSELEPEEFDITVVTLEGAEPDLVSELPTHVEVVELGIESKLEIHRLAPLRNIISNSDILICSLFHAVVVGSVIGSLVPGSRQIYTWRHNTDSVGLIRRYLYSLAFQLSDGILVDSESTADRISSWGVDAEDVSILPLAGIDVDRFPEAQYNTSEDKVRVGTVARLLEQKGYPELIRCAKQLPEYEFHVVGDGPLAEKLQSAPSNVICHGRVSQAELERLWGTFDIYFQPSRYEGLCITAIEAMASGLPVVASDVDGLSESIVDGETGYLVKQGEIDEYCTRIRELANDRTKRQEFGEQGKDRVSEQYSSTALAERFQDVVSR